MSFFENSKDVRSIIYQYHTGPELLILQKYFDDNHNLNSGIHDIFVSRIICKLKVQFGDQTNKFLEILKETKSQIVGSFLLHCIDDSIVFDDIDIQVWNYNNEIKNFNTKFNQSSIHNTHKMVRFIQEFCSAGMAKELASIKEKKVVQNLDIVSVPSLNPDGIDLCDNAEEFDTLTVDSLLESTCHMYAHGISLEAYDENTLGTHYHNGRIDEEYEEDCFNNRHHIDHLIEAQGDDVRDNNVVSNVVDFRNSSVSMGLKI
jgi:hypothetical protein